ncbi:hypothetical protein SLA2020_031030 [Shorea laevis]
MEMMRMEIDHLKEEKEVMKCMMEKMGRIQACLSQDFATFNPYGICPPMISPSFPHAGQAFPPTWTSCPFVGPSFQHDMPMQLPMEPGIPMGTIGRQSQATETSPINPLQDDYVYQPRFDADYPGPFGPE